MAENFRIVTRNSRLVFLKACLPIGLEICLLPFAMTDQALWLNLLLSGPNPGRWKMIREIIQRALPKDEIINLYVSPGERNLALEAIDSERVNIGLWEINDGAIDFSTDLSENRVNLILYGLPEFADDLIEALVSGYQQSAFEMGRIATHVHCGWCANTEEARAWYEAAIHFSDLVLLDNRDEVEDSWVRDYQERFRKQRYPCLFDLVRRGLPKHPDWLFDSQPRRLSLVFDPDDLSGFATHTYGFEDEEEELDAEEEAAGDPYLRRNIAGEREKSIRPLPFSLDEAIKTKTD